MKTKLLLVSALLCVIASSAYAVDGSYKPFGLDLSARDLSVKPGDDFWRYANGRWAARTPFPPNKEAIGVSGGLSEQAAIDVGRILDDAAAHKVASEAGHKMGDLYAGWLDTQGIDRRGLAPLRPYLARISAIDGTDDLQRAFATPGYASPLIFGSMVDFNDPSHYIAYVGQGDLGMPRDYYVLPGAKYDAYRLAYRAYIVRLFGLASIARGPVKADAIVALETRMAKVLWSAQDVRDPAATARMETTDGLAGVVPSFNWALLLHASGIQTSSLALTQDTAVEQLGRIMRETPIATWRDYLAFRFISDHADALPRAFGEASFGFYSTTLYGQKTAPARRATAVVMVNRSMGDAVGQLYLQDHFPAAARQQAGELVQDIRAAYGDLIRGSGWMDTTTRAAALAKLDQLKAHIGGPDTVLDYAALRIERNDPLGNMVRIAAFDHAREVAQAGSPVDRSTWVTPPQVANGFYDPTTNQIFLAAALLQPPLLDPDADPAVNYGAMGAFIGHEIGHAFDDQGSEYGPTGKREDWWSAETKRRFDERAAAISAQYASDEALPGVKVNGAQTLGENMADISGLDAAFLAYRKYQDRHGKAPALNGLTGEQRFFLSNAQLRRTKVREATLRQLVLFDTHAPSTLRVNRVMRNMDAWYEVFGAQPGDALYLPSGERVHVW